MQKATRPTEEGRYSAQIYVKYGKGTHSSVQMIMLVFWVHLLLVVWEGPYRL